MGDSSSFFDGHLNEAVNPTSHLSSLGFVQRTFPSMQRTLQASHSGMAHYGSRSRNDLSFLEMFSEQPSPCAVLLIIGLVSCLICLPRYVSYVLSVKSTGENMGWVLPAIPLAIMIIVRCYSNADDCKKKMTVSSGCHGKSDVEGFPWRLAALLVLLLFLTKLHRNQFYLRCLVKQRNVILFYYVHAS
ncbi:uncharacterized protein J3R85_005507 [Psidium guajava]|nr:uncharacterized protein J3R85_005507 [Psidium guajava]